MIISQRISIAVAVALIITLMMFGSFHPVRGALVRKVNTKHEVHQSFAPAETYSSFNPRVTADGTTTTRCDLIKKTIAREAKQLPALQDSSVPADPPKTWCWLIEVPDGDVVITSPGRRDVLRVPEAPKPDDPFDETVRLLPVMTNYSDMSFDRNAFVLEWPRLGTKIKIEKERESMNEDFVYRTGYIVEIRPSDVYTNMDESRMAGVLKNQGYVSLPDQPEGFRS